MMKLCISLAVLTVLVHLSHGVCPPGYLLDAGSNRCIIVIQSAKTWAEARAACRQDEGDLLTIPTPHNPVAGPDALKEEGREYWMGLNDRNVEGIFKWNNQKEAATYVLWGEHQPLTGEAGTTGTEVDCAAIVRTGFNGFKYVNQPCTKANYYVCERLQDEDLEAYKIEKAAWLNVTCPSDEWTRVPNRRLCVKKSGYVYDQLSSMDVCYDANWEYDQPGSYNLLHVTDFDINDYIKSFFSSGQLWISPTDWGDEGIYKDTALIGSGIVTYLPWKPGTTQTDDKDCVVLEHASGADENKMINVKCNEEHDAICQYLPRDPPPPRQDKVCPAGWQKFAASETCFKVMGAKRVMWQKARDQCKEMDSDLAVIPDQDTLDFVKGIVSGSRYWIGLTDKEKNGKFSWLGQDTEIGFSAWRNPPRNLMGDEYCVELIGKFDGMWNDKSCSAKKNFICQKDAK